MRKVEQAMVEALRWAHHDAEGPIFRGGNTVVTREHFGTLGTFDHHHRDVITLHGNTIAVLDFGRVYISTAGWNTATTRSRINAILSHFAPDYGVNSVKGVCILSKMVPIPSREVRGMVPCSAMRIGEVGDTLRQVGLYD